MNKVCLFLAMIFTGSLSFADVEISAACKETLQQNMLQQASNLVGTPINADDVEFTIYVNSQKDKVRLSLTRNEDGMDLDFTAIATADQIQNCEIQPTLDLANSCRYSNYGEKDIDEILVFGDSQAIADDKNLNDVQKDQIKSFLIYGNEDSSLNDLIASTDDGEVLYMPVTLPDGQKLDYYKAYGGDNPYGVFYYQGTLDYAGTNGDDSICIAF